jgi:hypothetical protein
MKLHITRWSGNSLKLKRRIKSFELKTKTLLLEKLVADVYKKPVMPASRRYKWARG